MIAHAAAGEMNIGRALRFGIVGAVSTATYFVVTAVVGNPPVLLDPSLANLLGFLASVGVSYIGHHYFTFQVAGAGAHAHYAPRFVVTTAILFAMSAVVMAVSRYWLGLDHTLATAIVTVSYPVASYALNTLWTFASAGKGGG